MWKIIVAWPTETLYHTLSLRVNYHGQVAMPIDSILYHMNPLLLSYLNYLRRISSYIFTSIFVFFKENNYYFVSIPEIFSSWSYIPYAETLHSYFYAKNLFPARELCI